MSTFSSLLVTLLLSVLIFRIRWQMMRNWSCTRSWWDVGEPSQTVDCYGRPSLTTGPTSSSSPSGGQSSLTVSLSHSFSLSYTLSLSLSLSYTLSYRLYLISLLCLTDWQNQRWSGWGALLWLWVSLTSVIGPSASLLLSKPSVSSMLLWRSRPLRCSPPSSSTQDSRSQVCYPTSVLVVNVNCCVISKFSL